MADLLEPREQDILLPDGSTKTYILSKFPAVSGREIVTQYPTSAMPKLGEYKINEELMLKLMSFVAVPMPNGAPPLRLTNRILVDQHVPDFETLMKIEWAMMEYNCSFFGNGSAQSFLDSITQKARQLITSMLTDLSAQSSTKN